MANLKISELPSGGSMLHGDVVPVVRNGVNLKATLDTELTLSRVPMVVSNHAPQLSLASGFTCLHSNADDWVPWGADYEEPLWYMPGYCLSGTDIPLNEEFTLQATFFYQGTWYDLEFFKVITETGGVVAETPITPVLSYTFAANSKSVAVGRPVAFPFSSIPGGTRIFTRTRRVMATSARALVTHATQSNVAPGSSGSWAHRTNDNTTNYLHGEEGHGAEGLFNLADSGTTLSDGRKSYSITGVNVTKGGGGYQLGRVWAYDAQQNRSALIQARTVGAGGVVPTGLSGSGMGNTTGWSKGVALWVQSVEASVAGELYKPMLISGRPTKSVNALLIKGASTDIGYGGGDSYGDQFGSVGPVERAADRQIAICNASYPGITLQALAEPSKWVLSEYIWGPHCNLLLVDPINDPGAGFTAQQTVDIGNTLMDRFRLLPTRYRCSWITPTPRVPIGPWTDNTQVPNPDYAKDSALDFLLFALRNPSGPNRVRIDFPIFDINAAVCAPGNNYIWRYDLGGSLTYDGTHYGPLLLNNINVLMGKYFDQVKASR